MKFSGTNGGEELASTENTTGKVNLFCNSNICVIPSELIKNKWDEFLHLRSSFPIIRLPQTNGGGSQGENGSPGTLQTSNKPPGGVAGGVVSTGAR